MTSNLLDNPKVIRWCYEGITDISLKNTESEEKLRDSKEIEKKYLRKAAPQVIKEHPILNALVKDYEKTPRAS